MTTLFSDIQIGEQFRLASPKYYAPDTVFARINPGRFGDARSINAVYLDPEIGQYVLVRVQDSDPVTPTGRTVEIVAVTVESEPHTKNLDGVLLNRPAPTGGAFLIGKRLSESVWKQMKAAGARYLSSDDLEEFDMFDARPGWRYSLAALEVLIRNGYFLEMRGQTLTSLEDLRFMFTEEAIYCYHENVEKERRWAEQEHQARIDTLEAERAGLVASLKAETGLDECFDWSWDDFRFEVGSMLRETEHYQAHEYKTGGELIGFTIKEKK